jgi:hypothetical protein
VLDDPWVMLEHLEAIFATAVGQTQKACPDAVNVAWLPWWCLMRTSKTRRDGRPT